MKNIETKTAKNGAILCYVDGKRVSESDAAHTAVMNGNTYYTASNLGYTGHYTSKDFVSPISAFKWLRRLANKSINYADGSWEIKRREKTERTIIFQWTEYGGRVINDDELKTYIEEIDAAEYLDRCYEDVKSAIEFYCESHHITVEQAEQIYVIAHTVKNPYDAKETMAKMIEDFQKLNAEEIQTVTEADVEDYAVTADAQDVATNAEINAAAITAIETKISEVKEEIKDITAELSKETNSDIRDARLRATRREFREDLAALEAELANLSNTEADAITAETQTTAEVETATEVETEELTADTFDTEKARLQAELDAVKITYDEKDAALEQAKREARKACDAYEAAKNALANFYANEAEKLNEQIHLPNVFFQYTNQDGESKLVYAKSLCIAAEESFDFDTNSTKHFFAIKSRYGHKIYGLYDSPEQAELAIKQLTTTDVVPAEELTADTETVVEADVPAAETFDAEKARLQAHVDARQAELDKAKAEHDAAKQNLNSYFGKQANQLTADLHDVIADKTIRYYRHSGAGAVLINGENLYIDATTRGDFTFTNWNGKRLATYDTPAQVRAVIARIKLTVDRGESQFTFPTIAQLSTPDKFFDRFKPIIDDWEEVISAPAL